MEPELVQHVETYIPDASFSITLKDPIIEITNTIFNSILFFTKPNWRTRLEREAYVGENFSIMYMPEQYFKIFVAEEHLLKRLGNEFNYDYVIIDLKKVVTDG